MKEEKCHAHPGHFFVRTDSKVLTGAFGVRTTNKGVTSLDPLNVPTPAGPKVKAHGDTGRRKSEMVSSVASWETLLTGMRARRELGYGWEDFRGRLLMKCDDHDLEYSVIKLLTTVRTGQKGLVYLFGVPPNPNGGIEFEMRSGGANAQH